MAPRPSQAHLDSAFLQSVLQQTSDLIFILAEDGGIVRSFGSSLLGYDDDELVGRNVFDLIHPEDLEAARREFVRVLAGEPVAALELRGMHREGEGQWHEVRVARYVLENGGVHVVSVNRDINKRKLAEAEIAESEKRYRALVDQSPLGILLIDRDLNLISANDAYAQQVGAPSLEALRGHNIMASPALDAAGVQAIAARVQHGETITTSVSYRSLFDKQVDVRVNISPVHDDSGSFAGAQLLFEDISESRRLEEQLRHSQKMEAVGRLAGGVAHDFNNNLTVMLGFAEFLAEQDSLGVDEREAANEIVRAAERSASLTGQLLAFSRRHASSRTPIDLGVVVAQLEPLLTRTLGKNIVLTCVLSPDLPLIAGDPLLFEQAIVNLAVNARDAMPEGGELRIHVGCKDGDRVVLSVQDDGIGMDEETRRQSFEPFFTTKDDKGSGLGLAMVYGIVQQFDGEIEITSQLGEGSCFRMSFPSIEAEAVGQQPSRANDALGGNECILLLEDQSPVRRLVSSALRRRGYRVLEACTSEEALAELQNATPRVDLFLSDVNVPDRPGPETAALLRARQPDLRVLYISGYTETPRGAEGQMPDGFELLPKPFTLQHLVARVRANLDGDGS